MNKKIALFAIMANVVIFGTTITMEFHDLPIVISRIQYISTDYAYLSAPPKSFEPTFYVVDSNDTLKSFPFGAKGFSGNGFYDYPYSAGKIDINTFEHVLLSTLKTNLIIAGERGIKKSEMDNHRFKMLEYLTITKINNTSDLMHN